MLFRGLVVYDPVRESMDKLYYYIYLNNFRQHIILIRANMILLGV